LLGRTSQTWYHLPDRLYHSHQNLGTNFREAFPILLAADPSIFERKRPCCARNYSFPTAQLQLRSRISRPHYSKLAGSSNSGVAYRSSGLTADIRHRCLIVMAVNISQPFGCDNAALFVPNHTTESHQLRDWHIANSELDYIPFVLPSAMSLPLVERPACSGEQHNLPAVPSFVREMSIPVDQLRNEVLWPSQSSNSSRMPRTNMPV
jgi:hypothetical protein